MFASEFRRPFAVMQLLFISLPRSITQFQKCDPIYSGHCLTQRRHRHHLDLIKNEIPCTAYRLSSLRSFIGNANTILSFCFCLDTLFKALLEWVPVFSVTGLCGYFAFHFIKQGSMKHRNWPQVLFNPFGIQEPFSCFAWTLTFLAVNKDLYARVNSLQGWFYINMFPDFSSPKLFRCAETVRFTDLYNEFKYRWFLRYSNIQESWDSTYSHYE